MDARHEMQHVGMRALARRRPGAFLAGEQGRKASDSDTQHIVHLCASTGTLALIPSQASSSNPALLSSLIVSGPRGHEPPLHHRAGRPPPGAATEL